MLSAVDHHLNREISTYYEGIVGLCIFHLAEYLGSLFKGQLSQDQSLNNPNIEYYKTKETPPFAPIPIRPLSNLAFTPLVQEAECNKTRECSLRNLEQIDKLE